MDAESTVAEKIAPPNNGSGESTDPAVLKEKVAEELKSAASLKGGGGEDGAPESVPIEKDDLLERLEKIETSPPEAPAKESDGSSAAATANDVDMENDDLIQRLEAMEKGEAEETAAVAKEEDKKEELPAAEVSHQNGLEKSGEAEPLVEEKMEVDAAVVADKKDDVSSSDSAAAPETTANGSSTEHDKEEQQPTSSAKRRHSEDEELEPSSKKVHVEEETKPKSETVIEPEEKKEEPIVEQVEEAKSVEKEATPEPTPSVVEEPKAEEKVPVVEEEPPKEPESETVDSKPKEEVEVQEKPTEQEKPLEESAPPPEPDPVQEEPAVESAPEEKKEEPAPVVEEQEQKPEDPKEDVKTVDDQPEAETVAEKPEAAVESTDKPEPAAEEVRDPVAETKDDPVASTETAEPAATAAETVPKEEESKPEPSEATLADTEPKTDVESQEEQQPTSSSPEVKEKTDDAISSSSEPKEPLVSSEVVEKKSPETETVTSSDEKPAAPEPEVVQSAVVEPAEAPQVDEAMEVDSEPVVEKSTAEVSEAPSAKKEAYLCTEKKVEEPESAPVAGEPEKEVAPVEEEEQMEVDSAAAVAVAPSQSKSVGDDVTEGMNTSSEELIKSLAKADDDDNVADSQSETEASTVVSALDKNVDAEEVPPAAADQSKPAEESKVLDESIECPTSSSDKMADRLKQRLDLISNGSSTPNAAVSSSNVYNSTPIQKQFEISSENVSKITRPSVDNSRQEEDEEHSAIVADNSVAVDEKEAVAVASTSGVTREPESKKDAPETSKETASSVKEESSLKSSETSEVDSCTASSALNTAEEANLYASNARKFNGISSTSGSELDDKSAVAPASNVLTTAATTTTSTTVNKLDLTPALTSEEALYEVSVWFDGVDLQFLSVEKVVEHKLAAPGASTAGSTPDLTGIDSSKQSSNGSVASLGPFPLPPARPTADSGMSHSSTTDSSGTGASQFKSSLPKMKQTVRGAKALASLMIQEFQKIKRALSPDDELSDAELDQSNLKTPKTAAKKAVGRGHKRTHTESEADEEPKSKQAAAKSAKKQKASTPVPAEAEPAVNQDDWLCCLARWTDRKYYAGKVTGYKGDNKYMVLFEDGASKALSKDVIVIGDKDTLPIVGHAVHALTGGDTYEPGFVDEVKRNDANEVSYVVRIGEGTVEVTASDMYLNEEQAKYINKACKAAETGTGDDPMQSPSASGKRGSATNTPILQTPDDPVTSGEKGSRSTRSKRGGDKPQTPVTPEAGYSGGVGKKGRRGRRLS